MNNTYIGHSSQVYGVEEHRLVGGKGDGMRLLQVTNGKGLAFTVSADRCADIPRLSYKGINMGYFSPCGYVAPAYYDSLGDGFLYSFTAGFLTTCGLNGAGAPSTDAGEYVPMHGTIANTPAEYIYWTEENDGLHIRAVMKDERIFSHKMVLTREIITSLDKNEILIKDTVVNNGDAEYPLMLLYHMNMGYPLLSENAKLYIPAESVVPRDEEAAKGIDVWNVVEKPQAGYAEQCFFHHFENEGLAAIFNPDINIGLAISYDAKSLPFFTEWKMMGQRDYVMGLEPGNCHPNGRAKVREEGNLVILKPQETVSYEIKITMLDTEEAFWALKK